MKCAPPFPLQGFPTFFGNLSPYHCARNFDLYCEVEIFLPLCFVELLSIYLQLNFDKISHTLCEKTAMHSLVCLLRSLLLTTCSVIVQTSSTIWHCFGLNGQKTIKIDA